MASKAQRVARLEKRLEELEQAAKHGELIPHVHIVEVYAKYSDGSARLLDVIRVGEESKKHPSKELAD